MRYSLFFPGQGAQRPGMGKTFYDKYEASRRVFEEADEALGFSLTKTIFEGTPEELAKTQITQPSILVTSIAAFMALQTEMGQELTPCTVAGHSLGEYTSLVASGVLSLADGVRLVHVRGGLMQDAVPLGEGMMTAVIGLNLEQVEEICAKAAQGEVCQAANVNAPTQIVISGHTAAVERAAAMIEADGSAKAIPLRVSAPFHCDLMKPVAEKLKAAFEEIEWHAPKFPIISNVDAKPVTTVGEIKDALYRQTYSPVLWCQSVLEMENSGTDGYIELGPGSVLSGLVRKICKGKRPYPVSDTEELDKAVSFLRGEAE